MSQFLEKLKPFIQKRSDNLQAVSITEKNKIDFCDIFNQKDISTAVIIAEIKFASPSRGKIYPGKLSCLEIAQSYINNQASALSVLTEPDFFKGYLNYIKKIRKEYLKTPILCKDFILSEKQIAHALLAGANAVLLIVSFLEQDKLKKLYNYAVCLNLTPVIEVHNEQELEQALALNPKVIGINNRNLNTLEINLNTSRIMIKKIPKSIFAICESGIKNHQEILEMTKLGFDGFLIGTQFMLTEAPGLALKQLLNEVNHAG